MTDCPVFRLGMSAADCGIPKRQGIAFQTKTGKIGTLNESRTSFFRKMLRMVKMECNEFRGKHREPFASPA